MHPAILVLLAVMLMLNGWRALRQVIYVPLRVMLHTAVEQTVDTATDEELAAQGMTREQFERSLTLWRRFQLAQIFSGLAQLGFAASLAGIIMWRGYAVYSAIGFALLFFILHWAGLSVRGSLAISNLFGLAAAILMLRFLPPVAWNRLMTSDA